MPNNAYASGTVMYSLDLGIFLTTSSNLCNLCSSSLRRFHAILEHLGEQYQDSIVLAKNSSPQIWHFRFISNFAAGIIYFLLIFLILNTGILVSVILSTFKCRYNYGTNIR